MLSTHKIFPQALILLEKRVVGRTFYFNFLIGLALRVSYRGCGGNVGNIYLKSTKGVRVEFYIQSFCTCSSLWSIENLSGCLSGQLIKEKRCVFVGFFHQ